METVGNLPEAELELALLEMLSFINSLLLGSLEASIESLNDYIDVNRIPFTITGYF
jgi:hypothetical protein